MAKARGQHWSMVGVAALSLHLAVLGLAFVAPQKARNLRPEVTMFVSLEVKDNALRPSEPSVIEVPDQASPRVAHALFKPRMNGQALTPRTRVGLPPASALPNELASESKSARGANDGPVASSAGESVDEALATNASVPAGRAQVAPKSDTTGDMGALARKPRLLSAGAACQGVFSPDVIGGDKVTIVLTVDAKGNAVPTTVRTSSTTAHAALKAAAKQCARRLRFDPARSVDGSAVAATSIVSLTLNQRRPGHPGRTRREGTI